MYFCFENTHNQLFVNYLLNYLSLVTLKPHPRLMVALMKKQFIMIKKIEDESNI
jgi:hypothetical protein